MHERAILTILITGVLITYLITIIRVEDEFIRFNEIKLMNRKMINLINNLPKELETSEGTPCGNYTCIEEPLLNHEGFRIEITDLDEKIIWYYGETSNNISISIPRLINNNLGKVKVIA